MLSPSLSLPLSGLLSPSLSPLFLCLPLPGPVVEDNDGEQWALSWGDCLWRVTSGAYYSMERAGMWTSARAQPEACLSHGAIETHLPLCAAFTQEGYCRLCVFVCVSTGCGPVALQ